MKGPQICFVCLFLYAAVVVVFCFRLAGSNKSYKIVRVSAGTLSITKVTKTPYALLKDKTLMFCLLHTNYSTIIYRFLLF